MSQHSDRIMISIIDEVIDYSTASVFRVSLVKGLALGNCDIDVDCSRIRFADSIGIGEIVSLNRAYVGRIILQNVTYSLSRCLNRVDDSLLPPWNNLTSGRMDLKSS
jgi:hypothetical protein